MSYAGYGFNNMSSSDTRTVKHPSSSLLVIDSEDRNVSSSANVSASSLPDKQPWNNFIIQTPDRLATGAINRINLRSIRFPWFIPNIVDQNSAMKILLATSPAGPFTTVSIGITAIGFNFTSPKQIADDINSSLSTQAPAYPITVEWIPSGQYFEWSWNASPVGTVVQFQPTNGRLVQLSQEQYSTQPSLARTMGFNFGSLTFSDSTTPNNFANTDDVIDNFYPCGGTDLLYTRYVDIVSTRLLQYRKMIDGASKNSNKKAIITRVYCANENSQNSYDLSGNIIPIGSQPFIIHRQISEKNILWNSEATVDYLDFQVLDEFGRLVELPAIAYNIASLTYPSFQMTFTLSE